MVLLRRFCQAGFLAGMLCLSCEDDPVNLPFVTKPDSPDIINANESVVVSEQPGGFPRESDAVLMSGNNGPVLPGENGVRNMDLCLQYYEDLYEAFYAMVPGADVVSQSCNQLELKDNQTGNSLKVKLHGDCWLDIDLSTQTADFDTTINICRN